MAKTLELLFVTETGDASTISIDSPKEPIDTSAIQNAMNDIISSNAFYSTKGKLVGIKGARVIDRQVTEYEIVS